MATSFTPGLRVAKNIIVRKERRLPLLGEVLVKSGDTVKADQVVAETKLPGRIFPVNVANALNVTPPELKEAMFKGIGDQVEEGEVLASIKSFFGLFRSEAKAPIHGTIESISFITGQVIVQAPPVPVQVKAFVDGRVIQVFSNEGVEVETNGSYIQGILGLGGETLGPIMMGVEAPNEVLTPDKLTPAMKGAVVIGGSLLRLDTVRRARELGINALVTGGFHDGDVKQLLGYDLGVAITGSEDIGLTLILTEGFGCIDMADRTFELLKSLEGRFASVNGATQIRAGVIRPEIIVTRDGEELQVETVHTGELTEGQTVRVIRNPYFGRIGKVTGLPPELTLIPTGAAVRILEVEFTDGERVSLPRTNIELILE
ncbi:MAG: hypothetical protein ISR91_00315 [Candidatus Delongbacteria bacterium]|nr:hypothetical protein [Candidatus Delongbacteria bacterium]